MNKNKFTEMRGLLEFEGGFFYLAGPYSGNEDYNFAEHERATVFLLQQKIWVHSPIVHCHEMARRYTMPTNAEFWRDYNFAMLGRSAGIIVYQLPNWEKSKGLQGEIMEAQILSKPICTLSLSDIP